MGFWATLDFVKGNGSVTIGNNPILVYEIEPDKLNFDSTTTVSLNERVYGKYYGLFNMDTLYFIGNAIEEKGPYPYE